MAQIGSRTLLGELVAEFAGTMILILFGVFVIGLVDNALRPVLVGKDAGLSWRDMVREGLAMRKTQELSWSQVMMAGNTPMLLRAAMVDGRVDLGVMASGQVVGVIDDLPSCADLIDRIIAEAEKVLTGLVG